MPGPSFRNLADLLKENKMASETGDKEGNSKRRSQITEGFQSQHKGFFLGVKSALRTSSLFGLLA